MALGAVVLQAASLGRSESFASIRWTPEAVGWLAYLVLFPSALGFLLYFALLERRGSIETNLVVYASPVFAALIGWALIGEPLTALTLVEFLVIVAGFVLTKWEVLRERLPGVLNVRF